MNIVILDYGIGNILSIQNALAHEGIRFRASRDAGDIGRSDGLILPGVGSFGHGMALLEQAGLVDVIVEYASSGKRILGICLGMQLLFESSTEFGIRSGLGLIEGSVGQVETSGKLPIVGWRPLEIVGNRVDHSSIFRDIDSGTSFYFVHSYCGKPVQVSATTAIANASGSRYCASVQAGSIYGCQFHPEKSGPAGLRLLRNFCMPK